ncbi:ABC transporter permease [Deltaproteobacteria bacterium]|nr:ABC transporter permease [Deltaproteobacteria bacterium]
MKAIFAIAKRELGGYFSSVIGWIVLVAFTLLAGLFFSIMLVGYASQAGMGGPEENITEMMVQGLFGNLSVIVLLVMPAITMGAIAADRREKSIELLLTSPIASWQIVAGKFLGGLAYAVGLVCTTLYVPAILYWLGSPDSGVFYANYGGFIVLMAVFVAVGLFTSSLTDNQLVALVIGFAINLSAWIVGWLAQILDEGAVKSVVEHISMLNHFEQLSKGVVHTNDAVYFASVILFFLFATTQRVEALRWR